MSESPREIVWQEVLFIFVAVSAAISEWRFHEYVAIATAALAVLFPIAVARDVRKRNRLL